jgi:hypothetical protein
MRRRLSDVERSTEFDGTIGDTQAFCWAALRQFDRRESAQTRSTPKEFGLRHADLHLLLLVAEEAVAHVVWVEKLLCTVGEPQTLPPDEPLRRKLREARNLLAEHRDGRVLYWRLTGSHTPHVIASYQELEVPMPSGAIDSEVVGYGAPPGATPDEVAEGQSLIGTIGGLLSLPQLRAAFIALQDGLADLALAHQGRVGETPSNP